MGLQLLLRNVTFKKYGLNILLFFLFIVICVVSVISSVLGTMEVYVAVPIAFLSMVGIIILVIDTRKENYK